MLNGKRKQKGMRVKKLDESMEKVAWNKNCINGEKEIHNEMNWKGKEVKIAHAKEKCMCADVFVCLRVCESQGCEARKKTLHASKEVASLIIIIYGWCVGLTMKVLEKIKK